MLKGGNYSQPSLLLLYTNQNYSTRHEDNPHIDIEIETKVEGFTTISTSEAVNCTNKSKQTIIRDIQKSYLQKINNQFRLEAITHLNKGMIRLVTKKFNPHCVPIKRE